MASTTRALNLLTWEKEVNKKDKTAGQSTTKEGLLITHLSFTYPETNQAVFEDFNIAIKKIRQ